MDVIVLFKKIKFVFLMTFFPVVCKKYHYCFLHFLPKKYACIFKNESFLQSECVHPFVTDSYSF